MLSLWHNLHVRECQLDEFWSCVHTKETHLPGARLYCATYGDAWVWVAFAPVWRLALAFVIGKRDQASADLLLARVAHVTDKHIPFFTSDPLPDSVSRLYSRQSRSRVPGPSQRHGLGALTHKMAVFGSDTPTRTVRARGGTGRPGAASGCAGSASASPALAPPVMLPPHPMAGAIRPSAMRPGVTPCRPSGRCPRRRLCRPSAPVWRPPTPAACARLQAAGRGPPWDSPAHNRVAPPRPSGQQCHGNGRRCQAPARHARLTTSACAMQRAGPRARRAGKSSTHAGGRGAGPRRGTRGDHAPGCAWVVCPCRILYGIQLNTAVST
jgi:hypothetical protein